MKRGNFFSILTLFVLLLIFLVGFALVFEKIGLVADTGDPAIDILIRIVPFIVPILLFVAFARYLVTK